MATGSGSGSRAAENTRLDPAWKYCKAIPNNKNGTICNFCGLELQSGGITRFKYHLSHTDPRKNSRRCSNVPPEVKTEIRNLLKMKEVAKQKKSKKLKDIRAELRQSLADDEDEDKDDVFMYPADFDKSERQSYRAAIEASKASEWERQQKQSLTQNKRGSSSRSNEEPSSQFCRTQSLRESSHEPPAAPSLYKSQVAKQKKIKDVFSRGNLKEKLGRLVSKFFIYENLPPSKASSHHFKNMIAGVQEVGTGVPPPTPYEIKHKYLDMEHKEMSEYVDAQKEKWKTYGCTIMSDGWTGPTKLSIINFMVYCKGRTIFLRSVDSSNKIKDHKYIYDLLREVVLEVGKNNVVQIVTDNGSAFVKAGKKLMKKYNLYWTPCAAHCIDLIFEDIGKRDSVADVISKARQLTNYIYNHGWLLALMREICQGDIVRPGATRFATNYIALDSLLKKKSSLKQLFTSDDWGRNRLSQTILGKQLERQVLDHTFWDGVQHVVDIYEPLYQVLRVVDTEVVPTMPILYDLVRVMKEKVERLKGSRWMLNIIRSRWDRTLYHPLHAAAYYLNPRFQYRPGVGDDAKLIQAVHEVFNKLDPNSDGVAQFGNELTYFRDGRRGFADRAAIASRSTMTPSEWWVMYGHSSPTLRNLAVRILSQTVSSTACERNWSTFALIHTKQRNRLAYPKLQQFVFCYYNMKLRIRDMEAENDKVAEQDYLDLVEISVEVNDEEEDPLFQWVRPAHMDDSEGNPDPKVAAMARDYGINVHQVLQQEVGNTASGSKSGSSTDDGGNSGNSDGGNGGNDEGGNYGGNGGNEYSSNQGLMSPFTCEADFTHATQDMDHGSRAGGPGIGAIGKEYIRRRVWNQGESSNTDIEPLSASLDSLNMGGTDHSDMSQDSYAPETYGSSQFDWTTQNVFHQPPSLIPYGGQNAYQQNDWINPHYPIHGVAVGRDRETYEWHVHTYIHGYSNVMSWYQYCLDKDNISSTIFEPHRVSFWY